MPSYGGAHGPDGSKKSGDQGQGSRDSRGGNTGGVSGQGGSGFGGSGKLGEKNRMDKKTRDALKDAFSDPSRQLDTMTNEKAWRDADADALGSKGTLDEMLGVALGVVSPIEEARPWDDPDYQPDEDGNYPSDANWKADSAEIIGGVIGAGLGTVGGGTVVGGVNDLLGKPIPDINLGPDVFAGGGGTPSPQPGGGTGNGSVGGGVTNDQFGQPTQPTTPAKPPAEVPVQDLWEYPDEDTDVNAGAPQDGLSDEERRRRGNTSIVVLGQGGLAI